MRAGNTGGKAGRRVGGAHFRSRGRVLSVSAEALSVSAEALHGALAWVLNGVPTRAGGAHSAPASTRTNVPTHECADEVLYGTIGVLYGHCTGTLRVLGGVLYSHSAEPPNGVVRALVHAHERVEARVERRGVAVAAQLKHPPLQRTKRSIRPIARSRQTIAPLTANKQTSRR